MPHSSPPQLHTTTSVSHYIITFHVLHYATFHITHFAFQSHHVWNCNIPHRTTDISHTDITHHISLRTIIHIKSHLGAPYHITPTLHLTPRHTHHHILIQIAHRTIPQHTFQTTPHIPHCISAIILHHPAMSQYGVKPFHITRCSITEPHFTAQHTTTFHMYHTIIPHRITTFHNTSSVTSAWHHI